MLARGNRTLVRWIEQSLHQTVFIVRVEKGKIDKTPRRKDKIWSSRPISGFGGQLHKGEVLAPLTSIVLNENHLVSIELNVSLC